MAIRSEFIAGDYDTLDTSTEATFMDGRSVGQLAGDIVANTAFVVVEASKLAGKGLLNALKGRSTQ